MQTAPGGTPATCVTPGYEKLKCSKCDAEGTKAIPATGKHTPNSNGVCTVCSQLVVTEADYCTVTFRAGSSTTTERVRKGSAPAGLSNRPGLASVPGSHVFVGWLKSSTAAPGYRDQSTVPAGTTVSSAATYTALYRLNATGQNVSVTVGATAGKLAGADIRSEGARLVGTLTGGSSFSSISFASSTSGSGGVYDTRKQASLRHRYNDT